MTGQFLPVGSGRFIATDTIFDAVIEEECVTLQIQVTDCVETVRVYKGAPGFYECREFVLQNVFVPAGSRHFASRSLKV